MSRSGVFAIRVGYEGEGGTALREQSLTERQPDNSDVCLTVLIIYNMGAREKWIKDRSQGCRPKNIIFAHVQKTYENPMDFNHFSFRPNSPRELSFYFWSHVYRFLNSHRSFCFTSAMILIIFLWPLHLRLCINNAVRARSFTQTHFSPPKKTYCKTQVPLTICSKPTVKPQCRCWCDFCPTSPAPLLEIS